jgi:hypothetical protein
LRDSDGCAFEVITSFGFVIVAATATTTAAAAAETTYKLPTK